MKNLFQPTNTNLDEIVFQDRNKAYGAYALRHESNQMLTKALFIGVVFFAATSVVPFVVNALKTESKVNHIPKILDPVVLKPVDQNDKKPAEPIKITPAKPTPTATIDTRIATPTRDVVQDQAPAKISDYDKATPGFATVEGDAPLVKVAPPVITIPGPPSVQPPVSTVDENAIVSNVDVEASFAGGVNAFRTKVMQNFDTSSFQDEGGMISTTITFIVEKDGSISGIKADGKNSTFNREAIETIKKIKGKWIPAKIKGQPVRSYFKFPVSMKFE